MSIGKIIVVSSVFVVLNVTGAQAIWSDTKQDAETQTEMWPPEWLEGVWENESTSVTLDGRPTGKSFSFAKYYIFTSGYRFSVFEGRRVSATPMIGQTQHGDELHCLFKMTRNRHAMRTKFIRHEQKAEYTSYLVSSSDGKRYKLTRQLSRIPIDQAWIGKVKTTFEKEFYSPHSDSAQEILEGWMQQVVAKP